MKLVILWWAIEHAMETTTRVGFGSQTAVKLGAPLSRLRRTAGRPT